MIPGFTADHFNGAEWLEVLDRYSRQATVCEEPKTNSRPSASSSRRKWGSFVHSNLNLCCLRFSLDAPHVSSLLPPSTPQSPGKDSGFSGSTASQAALSFPCCPICFPQGLYCVALEVCFGNCLVLIHVGLWKSVFAFPQRNVSEKAMVKNEVILQAAILVQKAPNFCKL